MKKIVYFFLLMVMIASCVNAQEASTQGQEPFQALVQNALTSNARLMAKHQDIKKYFDTFLPLWKDLLVKLSSQESNANLEQVFATDEKLIQTNQPIFQKMKPPGELKDFQEAFLKGLDALGDWCMGMTNRIHYAKTDYQKDAYLKKLEGFRNEWFDEFFGPALDELNAALAEFSTSNWFDNLEPEQQKGVGTKSPTRRYLNSYYKIYGNYLKMIAAANKKARESKDDDENSWDFVTNLQKELKDIKQTKKDLAKLKAISPFEDFNAAQIQWLDAVERGTQKMVDLETATLNRESSETIQTLMNQKNQLDEESAADRSAMDKAFKEAMDKLVQSSPVLPVSTVIKRK